MYENSTNSRIYLIFQNEETVLGRCSKPQELLLGTRSQFSEGMHFPGDASSPTLWVRLLFAHY